MTLEQYAAALAADSPTMSPENRPVADFVARRFLDLSSRLRMFGRGFTPSQKEDQIQACMLGVVEGVREAQAEGADFAGPLGEGWDKRVLDRVAYRLREMQADSEVVTRREVREFNDSQEGEDD